MSLNIRDISVLKKIVQYCDEINGTIDFFGASRDTLIENNIFHNALALCILQIGELTTVLTEEFKQAHADIPWGDIKKMRNVVAHRYGEFDIDVLWETVTEDIAPLRDYCSTCLEQEAGV
jgi:uncharacterized protein with HEPN domain